VLVDVPTYFAVLGGEASSGWTNVTPAIKWQVSPVPGKIDLSLVAGAGLLTGTPSIAGHGVQPYLQSPWSWEVGGGWSVNGMITGFFFPSDVNKLTTETTLSIEKEVGKSADLFVEYVGDYPERGDSQFLLNSGGAYRFMRTQQIDFHVAFGLNNNAPSYIFGLGYSFRFDGLCTTMPALADHWHHRYHRHHSWGGGCVAGACWGWGPHRGYGGWGPWGGGSYYGRGYGGWGYGPWWWRY
jgi:Putative MetA-pathway of phenol degradation